MDQDTPLETFLAAVARKDRVAFRAIYERESKHLFGIAMAILRDRPAASDAVQDAFLRVWQRASQFDPARGEARSWLTTIVRHAALDLARARGREQPTGDPSLGDQPIEPEAIANLTATEDGLRLHYCLEQLDEKNRRFIVLAFVQGLSHAQIAAKAEMPLGSIKTWIRRGLQSLRTCMS